MTPAPANGAGSSSSGAPESGAPTKPLTLEDVTAVIAKALEPFAGKVGLLTEDLIKLRKQRERGAGDPPPESGAANPNGAPAAKSGGSDFLAYADLAEAMSRLPEAARKQVREQIEGGASVNDVLERVRFAQSLMGAAEIAAPSKGNGAEIAPRPAPPGRAESALPEPASPQFKTWSDWTAYRRAEPNKSMAYRVTHADFDPLKLPGSPDMKNKL